MTWLDCNQRSYIWIFGWTLREDVRLACAQMPELFFDLHVFFQLSAKEQKIIYANLYLNTIIDGDSQTSPLPIFPEGVGTSVHRLERKGRFPRSLVCGRMKKERYRKQDVSVSDLVKNKNFSLPLSFFLISVVYLSQFLSFWVKCSSLLSIGLLLSPVLKIDALKRTRNSWRSMIADLLLVDGK